MSYPEPIKPCPFCGNQPFERDVRVRRPGGYHKLLVQGIIGCKQCGFHFNECWWEEEIMTHIPHVKLRLWDIDPRTRFETHMNETVRTAAIAAMTKFILEKWNTRMPV